MDDSKDKLEQFCGYKGACTTRHWFPAFEEHIRPNLTSCFEIICPSRFVFKQSLQFMTRQYQCFPSKNIFLEKWWKLLRAWQWKRNSWALLECFKHWRNTVIDLSFYKGLTNLSFPSVKMLLSSNQVKHIFLFCIATFLGNIPIFFTKAGRFSFINISLQLSFFFFFF